ncbi:GNAT family N-acetyltransferase (plasmid) [Paraclostridium benzoelyticum]|uniref:GNAT family N-acetyltransferase n=1 Tax=Paraclostridium benzoelyticum TaxID=1629550 RepID=UPI0031CD06D5
MIKKLELKIPNMIYMHSFLENINDYKTNDDLEYFNMYKAAINNFEQYVNKLNNNAKGLDLPEGYIPSSTFWLVNDDNNVLGVVRIRHQAIPLHGHIGYDLAPRYRGNGYGNKILELALPLAKKLGINQVILNCESTNIRSQKVIQLNNGILFKTIVGDGKVYNQFIIEV